MPIEVDGAPINYELLPEHLRGGVERWIEHGVQPGSFLKAVLDNQLFQAHMNADDKSFLALRDICRWFYNHAPRGCYGSPEQTASWCEVRRREVA